MKKTPRISPAVTTQLAATAPTASPLRGTVALVLPTLAYQIEQALLAGAREILDNAGYQLVTVVGGYLSAGHDNINNRHWIYEFCANQQFSGTLFYGGGIGYRVNNDAIQAIAERFTSRPLINIGCVLEQIPSVLADNFSGMKALVEHLLRKRGLRRLAFVHGPAGNQEAQDRFNGFKAAHERYSLHIDEQLLVTGDFSPEGGRLAVEQLLAIEGRPFDGIVCANDLTARGVIEALRHRGVDIPGEIAVVGFDDFEYAAALEPPLTTVHYPAEEMGRIAARLLLQLLDDGQVPLCAHVSSFPVLRRSSGDSAGVIAADANSLYRDRWRHIQLRERHGHRLRFDRELFQANDFKQLLSEHGALLHDAGFSQLYLCDWSNESLNGQLLLRHALLNGQYLPVAKDQAQIAPGHFLPKAFLEQMALPMGARETWIVHPLTCDDQPFGYLLVAAEPLVESFTESLSLQFAEAINRQRLTAAAQAHRYELESSLAALKTAYERLDKAEKIATLGRLVAGISHELNTPIGSGITMATFVMEELRKVQLELQEGKLSRQRLALALSQSEEAAASIFRSLVRTASLVELFKSSSQGGEQRVQQASAWEVIHSALYRCKDGLSAELQHEVDCPGQIQLSTDIEALVSALVHLIENAATHAYQPGEKGRIHIEAHSVQHGRRVQIRFRDFGRGMDAEDLARLFEPFHTTHRGQGRTGLGLYLVYNLVSLRLRGLITVHSSLGKGTVFTLELPLLRDDGEVQDSNVISPAFGKAQHG